MGKNVDLEEEEIEFEDFFDNPYDFATNSFDIETVKKENEHLTNLND